MQIYNGIFEKQYSDVDILKIVTNFPNFILLTITYRYITMSAVQIFNGVLNIK